MSDPLKDVIAEMREIQRTTCFPYLRDVVKDWADRLAALAFSLEQERDEQQKEDTRVDGVPEGAHGDLPRHTTR
jgi:hypothetical protein